MLLSLAIWIPIVAGIAVLAVGERNAWMRWIAQFSTICRQTAA